MNTNDVATRLVELCRQGQYAQAQEELYGEAVVSWEAPGLDMPPAEGIDAVKAKTQQWAESVVEVHSAQVSDPLVAGNHFTITMENDATFKERGRSQLKEVCVYEVDNGKIVREQFFYNTGN